MKFALHTNYCTLSRAGERGGGLNHLDFAQLNGILSTISPGLLSLDTEVKYTVSDRSAELSSGKNNNSLPQEVLLT